MPPSQPARSRIRHPHARTLLAVVFVVAAAASWIAAGSGSGGARHRGDTWAATSAVAVGIRLPSSAPWSASGAAPALDGDGALDADDGLVPDGTTVFSGVPAVAELDPALLAALRDAADDAAVDGVTFEVNSGWRSRSYQEQLLRDAVAEYGSREEAARWVAPPDRSAHVSGDAVDLGKRASAWLSEHGAAYGLCQTYDNERWHYERRPSAAAHGCPDRYPDAAHDPRLHDAGPD